ncbi:SPFH domain-containing protein [Albimonas sp. CAU 1670]|uniref:prohibitin family protein n=1 Tax=Albimonas sp. CAU 1670 TaxID=3032599 RepID=UPI0023DBCC76|nr:SPFH domain-containing protein [Albimonas sp. CAU 1670]MDF2234789.1 SPFH domain-containing protein [Albimonas sp. CAU 1670]
MTDARTPAPDPSGPPPPGPPPSDARRRRDRREKPPLFSRSERIVAWAVGLTSLISIVLLILWNVIFVQILPGQAGVRYKLLAGGTDLGEPLPEGYALKLPWDRIYIYELRVQQFPFSIEALSSEGMSVRIEGNVIYRARYATLGELQKGVGPEYRARVVGPVSVAAIRHAVANHTSNELYSINFDQLKQEVIEDITSHAAAEVIEFLDVAVRGIYLPEQVTQAIDQKLAQEQLAASYEFRIMSEKQEAERRRIEAIGIRSFYTIVSEALNDSLLTWRGIEATVQLSKSPNAKVVVVGNGKDAMPLILGGELGALPATAQPIPEMGADQANTLPSWSEMPMLFPELQQQVDSRGARTLGALPPRGPLPADGSAPPAEPGDGMPAPPGGLRGGSGSDGDDPAASVARPGGEPAGGAIPQNGAQPAPDGSAPPRAVDPTD